MGALHVSAIQYPSIGSKLQTINDWYLDTCNCTLATS